MATMPIMIDTPNAYISNWTIDNYTWYGAFTCIDKSSYSAITYNFVDGKEVNSTSIVTCDIDTPYCIDCGEAPYGSAICLNTTVEPDYCNWTAFPILFDGPMNYTFDGNFSMGEPVSIFPVNYTFDGNYTLEEPVPIMYYNMSHGDSNGTMWVPEVGGMPLDGNFSFFDNITMIMIDQNGTVIDMPPFLNETLISPPETIAVTGKTASTNFPDSTAGDRNKKGKVGGMGMMGRMRYLASTMPEQEKTGVGGGAGAVPKKKSFVRGGGAM